MLRSLLLAIVALCNITAATAQVTAKDYADYSNYDFKPGETALFEDNMMNDKAGATPLMWTTEGGKATVIKEDSESFISINEYYTKITPKLKANVVLPDSFTIEYDTWLDAGYDGNPGVEIHLASGDNEVVITPNKHQLSVTLPGHDPVAKDNPEEYFGENKFYDRWVHISIAYLKKHLVVYLDHYKQIDLPDCFLKPQKVVVTGNTSAEMKILLKNFRIAKNIPHTLELKNGKFVTHAIKFDVGKSVIKPESTPAIKEIQAYLSAHPDQHFEISGHTDSDGDDASNIKLSEARANAVKAMLVSMGIKETQLISKGYGESKPMDSNTTAEGKTNNRRVELTELK